MSKVDPAMTRPPLESKVNAYIAVFPLNPPSVTGYGIDTAAYVSCRLKEAKRNTCIIGGALSEEKSCARLFKQSFPSSSSFILLYI